MIEYTDGRRTPKEIRQMLLKLISREHKAEADKLRRRLQIEKIKRVLKK